MTFQSVHIRLDPALLAELDRRRRALPVEASRNAYATYLLSGALGSAAPARSKNPAPGEPVHVPTASHGVTLHPPPMTGPEALTRPWRGAQDAARAKYGARVRDARKAAGLSQAATGEAAGVSEDVVRRCERGERDLARYPKLLAWVEEREAAAKTLGHKDGAT